MFALKNPRISTQISLTVNLQNFESVKVQAGIEVDLESEEAENIEETYKDLYKLNEKVIFKQTEDIKRIIAEKRKMNQI